MVQPDPFGPCYLAGKHGGTERALGASVVSRMAGYRPGVVSFDEAAPRISIVAGSWT